MRDFIARTAISRLTLYVLAALTALSWLLAALSLLPYAPLDMVYSAALLLASGAIVNAAFALTFGVRSNIESVLITGLILALVITPFHWNDLAAAGFAVFAAAWAMASKYILVLQRRHVFNPAALGMAIAAAMSGTSVSWWIGGSLYLLPVLLPGGALIVYKMRCYDLVLSFVAATLLSVVAFGGLEGAATGLEQVGLHSMFLFFAFVMLTEPRTAPIGRPRRMFYAALVGVLFAPEFHLGSFYLTPELALLVGNIFAALGKLRRPVRRAPMPRSAPSIPV